MRQIYQVLKSVIFISCFYTNCWAQEFSFMLNDDSIVIGNPGKEIVVYGTITNLSLTNDVEIYIVRKWEVLPTDWLSSMCIDICLPPNSDSTYLYLYAGASQNFSFHFFTGASNDTGMAQVSFRNTNNLTEVYYQNFYGITDSNYSNIVSTTSISNELKIYPNPCKSLLNVRLECDKIGKMQFEIYNIEGGKIKVIMEDELVNISDWENGCYFIKNTKTNFGKAFIVNH